MFNNFSIAKKLSLSFGLLLALLAFLSLIGIRNMQTTSAGFAEYRQLAKLTNLVGRIQANMLSARMAAKSYTVSGEARHATTFNERLSAAQEFSATAQHDITQPDRQAAVQEIVTALRTYENAFQKVMTLMAERDRLVNKELNLIGPSMEKKLTEVLVSAEDDGAYHVAFNTGLGMKHLLLARLYVVKFLESNETSAVERVIKEKELFNKQLENLEQKQLSQERRSLLEQIKADESTYFGAFDAVVKTIEARNQLITGTMDKIGPQVAEHVEALKLSIKQQQDDLGPRLEADNRKSDLLTKIISLSALLIGIGITVLLVRSLSRPIIRGVEMAKEIAKGDFSMRLQLDRRDEIGQLATALNSMADSLLSNADVATEIAAGNLDVEVVLASEKDQLGQALKSMTENLNKVMAQIHISGEQIASGSNQVASASQALSQGATEQASSLEEISASLNEMAGQTGQNAENARQASSLTSEVQVAAQKGNEQMQGMVSAMEDINEAGQNISKIIKTIDEIAFQTNLLALNAAVEAARAGQHGKGFAVVAEEVRNLAARSAKAAEETAALIQGSVEKTENGGRIAAQTAQALQEIVNGVTQVADLVGEISAASTEQAQGISQVNQGVGQIDQVTQQNTASAEESAAAAEELSSQAEELRGMLQRFTLRSDGQGPRSPSQEDKGASQKAQKKLTLVNDSWDQPTTRIALENDEFGRY